MAHLAEVICEWQTFGNVRPEDDQTGRRNWVFIYSLKVPPTAPSCQLCCLVNPEANVTKYVCWEIKGQKNTKKP